MRKILTILAIFSFANIAFAAEQHHKEHLRYIPEGVMGSHTHEKGEWMVGYHYSYMEMNSNLDGKDKASVNDITNASGKYGFMAAPEDMTMEMHMFEAMYGLNDKATLMLMVPYKMVEMDVVHRNGNKITTRSEGLGDIKLTALTDVFDRNNAVVNAGFGFSLPTGDIDKKDYNFANNYVKLPYPMQLGSGTLDLLPSLTYTNERGFWHWGAQTSAVVRTGKNNNGYRLGNEIKLTSWVSRELPKGFTALTRVEAREWGNIKGADQDLNPSATPTARTDLRAGKEASLFLGANFSPEACDCGVLSFEIGKPIFQDLKGPQLRNDLFIKAGLKYTY
jgi:hypothetical protein